MNDFLHLCTAACAPSKSPSRDPRPAPDAAPVCRSSYAGHLIFLRCRPCMFPAGEGVTLNVLS